MTVNQNSSLAEIDAAMDKDVSQQEWDRLFDLWKSVLWRDLGAPIPKDAA